MDDGHEVGDLGVDDLGRDGVDDYWVLSYGWSWWFLDLVGFLVYLEG